MNFQNGAILMITSVCALLITSSCSSWHVYRGPGRRVGHGPPAHAPAYGHRHRHVCGVELVFDTDLGVYVVVGYPDHYYHDGHFYRLTSGVWEMSLRIDAGWDRLSGKPLPSGLRAKSHGSNKGHGRALAKGKGKHNGR